MWRDVMKIEAKGYVLNHRAQEIASILKESHRWPSLDIPGSARTSVFESACTQNLLAILLGGLTCVVDLPQTFNRTTPVRVSSPVFRSSTRWP
jgi:hypothetical protein